jgi:hypothetical protein
LRKSSANACLGRRDSLTPVRPYRPVKHSTSRADLPPGDAVFRVSRLDGNQQAARGQDCRGRGSFPLLRPTAGRCCPAP